jgi:hypothetical protein
MSTSPRSPSFSFGPTLFSLSPGETLLSEEVFAVNLKKQGRKEINAKNLTQEKRTELDLARAKEWKKMITSKAVIVHEGDEAQKIMHEVGIDRLLESRFVYTSEDGSLETALKARWCIRGYLDPDLLDLETASPTLSNEGFSIALQLLSSCGWRMTIGDIEAAFLRGDEMKREKGRVLVKLPKDGIPGVPDGSIIELHKPVYGLADAPKLWWQSLTKALKDMNMEQSKLDGCLFYSRDQENQLNGVIAFHVDDLILGGTKEFHEHIFQPLKKKYPFKHVKVGEGEFLGKMLKQNSDYSISITQRDYAEAVTCIPISKERRKHKDQETTEQEKGQLRAVLGEINWLVSGSRPDLAAACSLMQQRVTKSCVQDLIDVNKVVSTVCNFAAFEVRILPIPKDEVEIVAWSDASFANASEHKSQGGYLVCATERSLRLGSWGRISPWRWRSFKQDRQVASTLGAELLTLSRALAEAKWMRSLWCEAICAQYTLETDRMRTIRVPITIAIDSRPVFDHVNGQAMTIKDKRMAIEMLLVKQDVEKDNVSLRWLSTEHMLADMLTKINAPMELVRKVFREGRMILTENDEIKRWVGKIKRNDVKKK